MAPHFLPSSRGLAIQNLPGITEGLVEGPADLVNALIAADSTLPVAWYRQPLRISLQLEGVPAAVYPLWAFWMDADAPWEARFGPIEEWRSAAAAPDRGRSILVIARAEGRWDLPGDFSPELSRLLQERDLLGTPDGRMLVYAAPAAMPPREALHSAIGWFLDSMRPSSREPLPANCFVIRSGCQRVCWGLPLSAAVLVRISRHGLAARHPGPTLFRIPLTQGLCVQMDWNGPFLWGAWRAGKRLERFLTLGYRAGAATRGGLSVRMENEEQSRALFHGAIERAAGGSEIARQRSDGVLERSLRAMTRNLSESPELRRAMETPYAELLRTAAPDALTLFESASMPAADPLGPASEGLESHGTKLRKTFPPGGLCGDLQRHREVQIVFSAAQAASRSSDSPGRKPAASRQAGRTNAA